MPRRSKIRSQFRLRPAWSRIALPILAIAIGGCASDAPRVPVGDAAENIRKLALGYVQFAAAHGGVGPADRETLAAFIARQYRVSPEEAEDYFISPRDRQPYVIRWAKRPMGSAPLGPQSPTPEILVYERTGASGTRYIADGRLSIRELSAEEFSQVVPDNQATLGETSSPARSSDES